MVFHTDVVEAGAEPDAGAGEDASLAGGSGRPWEPPEVDPVLPWTIPPSGSQPPRRRPSGVTIAQILATVTALAVLATRLLIVFGGHGSSAPAATPLPAAHTAGANDGPISEVSLPTGIGCAAPHLVSPAIFSTIPDGQLDAADEPFLSAARGWLGGVVQPLVPLRGAQSGRVGLTSTSAALQRALITDQAFVDRAGDPVFGRALVPVSTAGAELGEAVVIPFPSPENAVRFDNTYITSSCANQFDLNLVTPGGQAILGAPAVTPANTVGLIVALQRPAYGHPDAVVGHAVIGSSVFLIIVYTDLHVLGSADGGIGQAMAAGLGAIGIGYRYSP